MLRTAWLWLFVVAFAVAAYIVGLFVFSPGAARSPVDVFGTGVKISELPEISSATADDIFAIVDSPGSNGVTSKITVSNLGLGIVAGESLGSVTARGGTSTSALSLYGAVTVGGTFTTTGTTALASGATVGGVAVCLTTGTGCPAGFTVPSWQQTLVVSSVATSSFLTYGNGTSTNFAATGTLSGGSTTVTTFNFNNATGSALFALLGNFTALKQGGTSVCLADGTNCPASTAVIPSLSQVIVAGPSATSTPAFNMGFTATTGSVVSATGTNLSLSGTLEVTGSSTVRTLNFSNASGTGLGATNANITGALTFGSATGANLNLSASLVAGSSTVTTLNFNNASGTGLSASNLSLITAFSNTGSSTIRTLNFSNATGTGVWATNGNFTGSLSAASTTVTTLNFTNATGTGLGSINGNFSGALTWANATGTSLNLSNTLVAASTTVTTLNFNNATGTGLGLNNLNLTGPLNFTSASGSNLNLTGTLSNTASTTLRTINFTNATGTGLGVSNFNVTTWFNFTAGTGTNLLLTNNFTAGSSTVTTLNFNNATGTGLGVVNASVSGAFAVTGSSTLKTLNFVSATGTNALFTGAFSVTGSSTLLTLNFSNATGSSMGIGLINLSSAFGSMNITVNGANATTTFDLTGAGGIADITSGGMSVQYEVGGNKINKYAIEFGASSTRCSTWSFVLPGNYDGAAVGVKFYHSAVASGTGAVVYSASAVAIDSGNTMDVAYGAKVFATNTISQVNNIYVTTTALVLTIGGSPSSRDKVFVHACREGESGDTYGASSTLDDVVLNLQINKFGE